MPKTVLVGLAEAAVKESTHRVERAIVNSGYRRPIDRVVINLAPERLTAGKVNLLSPIFPNYRQHDIYYCNYVVMNVSIYKIACR
jgi:hypothetical protein